MKRTIAIALAAMMALALFAACGSEPAAEETAPADEPEGESLLETAKTFEGAPVEDLIAAIGEPESSDYAPSCLGEGEDGNLYYDGFTVYTYRDTDGSETVSYVE